MLCIYCSGGTQVVNSRHQKRVNNIWRRRQCTDCGAIVTTTEKPDLFKSLLVRKGKHYNPFSRDKLFLSIHDSLRHRKTVTSDATGLTETVLGRLLPLITQASLNTDEITCAAIKTLQHFDKAAATYYEAFHPLSNL